MNVGQKTAICGAVALIFGTGSSHGQSETHGRKYQAPPATGHIVIVVEKSFNDKPLENAAVIFHATKNGKDDGNLEIKTNSQGKATMDLLEVGDHVRVQVFAGGYATSAQDFDVTEADQNILVKLQRPREQISVYQNNDGKASTIEPGLQEAQHRVPDSGVKATTAAVSGTLKDERGARIPGGIVRLHKVAGTGEEIARATDAEGNFRIDRVVPGSYELQLSAPGFTPTRRSVALSAGETEVYQETLHMAPDAGGPARSALPPASPAQGAGKPQ